MKLLNSFGTILVATVMVHGAPLAIEPSGPSRNNGVSQKIPDSTFPLGAIGNITLGDGIDLEVKNTDGEEHIAKRGWGSLFSAVAKTFDKEAAKEGVEQGADAVSQQAQESDTDVETRSLRGSSSDKSNKGNGGGRSWGQDIATGTVSSLIGDGIAYGAQEETAGEEDQVEKRAPRGGHHSGGGSRSGRKSSGGGSSSSFSSSSGKDTDSATDISGLGQTPKDNFVDLTTENTPNLIHDPVVNGTYIPKLPIGNATPVQAAK